MTVATAPTVPYGDALRDYIRAGLVLVPIPAGSKGPRKKGWNLRARCWANPGQVSDAHRGNIGLAHVFAGTCALDVDDDAKAGPALAALGIDLSAILSAPSAVHIRSGRPGRDKLLYRLREPLTSINRSASDGFELRCAAANGATVQDVLPPSIHPDTHRPYEWAGDWRSIPPIPDDLLAAWQRLLASTPARPTRTRRVLPAVIHEGERNTTMLSLAAGLVRKGFTPQGVSDRLQRINAERCDPPLGADEVDGLVARAVGYGSSGFAMLPHKLMDSPEWRALTPCAHDIILLALRRHGPDTAQTGFALMFADLAGRPGFGSHHTFDRARREAVASGILRLVRESHNTQTGVVPDLFTIAEAYSPRAKSAVGAKGKICPLTYTNSNSAAVLPEGSATPKTTRGTP